MYDLHLQAYIFEKQIAVTLYLQFSLPVPYLVYLYLCKGFYAS